MKSHRIKSFRKLVTLIFALGLCVSAAAQTKPDDRVVLNSFEREIENGRLAEVEAPLFKFVIANPKNAQGFYLLARLRYKQNRLAEAKSLLGKTLAIDSKLAPAALTLAQIHVDLGETEQARAVIVAIEDAALTLPATRLMAAETAARIGECERALAFTDKLTPALRNREAIPLRGACYFQAGDVKGLTSLIPAAKKAAALKPGVAVGLAEILFRAAMYRETADLARSVTTAAPRNMTALILLSKAQIALREYSPAKATLAQAEKAEPQSFDLLVAKSMLESEQGNNQAALGHLEMALAARPDDVEALKRFVVVSIRAGQAGRGLRAAEKLRAIQPENVDFLYLQGIAALQSNNIPIAETALREFMTARPTDSLGCLALGMTLAAQPARLDEARRQMESCLDVNPRNHEAAYQLGLSYKVQGDNVKAIEYLERTVRLAPEYALALRDLGAVYLQSGSEAKARPLLEKAVTLAPNDADAHFQLSRLYNLIGERELAKRELEIFQKLRAPKKEGM